MGNRLDHDKQRRHEARHAIYREQKYVQCSVRYAAPTDAQIDRVRQLLHMIEDVGLHKYCEMPSTMEDASLCIQGLESFCRRKRVFLMYKEGKRYATE